jgi:ribonuclease HI
MFTIESAKLFPTRVQDPQAFTSQLQGDKMVTMIMDGGACPNTGPAGWGVLIRQNGRFICLWNHYPKASNNSMEISAVIAVLTFVPPNMAVWLSTDSQCVRKGINEWMAKRKRNGGKNSKKAGIAGTSLWLALDEAIAIHRRVEF